MITKLKRGLLRRNLITKLKVLMPELLGLREGLKWVMKYKINDPLSALIEFLRIISPRYDNLNEIVSVIQQFKNRNLGDKERKIINILETIKEHIYFSGRNPLGINRTTTGETVTSGNVYLGGINGLDTKPVSEWLRLYPNTSNQHNSVLSIIKKQAEQFINSHSNPLLESIEKIKNYIESK